MMAGGWGSGSSWGCSNQAEVRRSRGSARKTRAETAKHVGARGSQRRDCSVRGVPGGVGRSRSSAWQCSHGDDQRWRRTSAGGRDRRVPRARQGSREREAAKCWITGGVRRLGSTGKVAGSGVNTTRLPRLPG
ncbi:glycine-rich cell wall structural protein 1.0-like [Iris pallida]|uniref:Glycine-rich cell wall structural protein 1.0-like n=1 Tax=Iris pallida TaxID=29817 RepID=A0AAX6EF12_IRIPA|nr:glycine-rich cell wall structural protein 1.0-like [Iris pallida]